MMYIKKKAFKTNIKEFYVQNFYAHTYAPAPITIAHLCILYIFSLLNT